MVKAAKNKNNNRRQATHPPRGGGRVEKPNQRDVRLARHIHPEGSMEQLSTKIRITNLKETVNDEDIHELFVDFGHIREINLYPDANNLQTAYVTYERHIDAQLALYKYDRVKLDGIPMKIEWVLNFQHQKKGKNRNQRGNNSRSQQPKKQGQQIKGKPNQQKNSQQRKRKPQKKIEPVTKEDLDAELDAYMRDAQNN